MATALTSDQVNYLIWRYLQECGYTYSVYVFQRETKVDEFHEHYGSKIKHGSLISLIQRGLQYRELELQINKDGTRKEAFEIEPYFPILPSRLTPSAVSGNGHMEVDEEDEDERTSTATAQNPPASVANSRKHGRGEDGVNGVSSGTEKTGIPDKKRRRRTTQTAPVTAIAPDRLDGVESVTNQVTEPSPPIEEVRPITNGCSVGVQVETATEITSHDTILLPNEDQRLNTLAWNPVEPGILVSGPQGAVGRMWSIPPGREKPIPTAALDHTSILALKKQEVTAVEWSPEGNILATGAFDGSIRVWTAQGRARAIFSLKCCAIMSLRWNRSSTMILSLYIDGGLLAWEVKTGELLQNFEGKLEVQDVTWVSDDNFAASGPAGDVAVYAAKTGDLISKFKSNEPVALNCLAWDDIEQRLASGDAKGRIAVWSNSNNAPIQLQAHDTQIRQILWQPQAETLKIGAEKSPQQRNPILATCGDGTSIRLWSVDTSSPTPAPPTLLHDLPFHSSTISKMSFSPNGKYIASGSYRKLYIWRVEDGFLAYLYDAITQADNILANGEVNGTESKPVPIKQVNGDVEMGGMEDGDADCDTDSGKGGLDLYDIAEISWENDGNRVAVAMTGLGVIIVPLISKSSISPPQLTPTPSQDTIANDNEPSKTDINTSVATDSLERTSNGAISEPGIINGSVANAEKSTAVR